MLESRPASPNQLSRQPHPKTKNKNLYRHLMNGEVVLMNRQPTLHKPSILGEFEPYQAKRLYGCIMPPAIINADFDGDEESTHFLRMRLQEQKHCKLQTPTTSTYLERGGSRYMVSSRIIYSMFSGYLFPLW